MVKSRKFYSILLIFFFVLFLWNNLLNAADIAAGQNSNVILKPSVSQYSQYQTNFRNVYNELYKSLYLKGRFETFIHEVVKIYNDFPEDIKDSVLFSLAKAYYKTGNLAKSYKNFSELRKYYPSSSIISSGTYNKTIARIIKLESENSGKFSLTYPVKLYYLIKDAGASQQVLSNVEANIISRLSEKIKVPINLQNNRISDYEQFKLIIVNQIWINIFPDEGWLRDAIDLNKNVSSRQIENSYNYYSKNLVIKVSVKDAYGVQSVRYIGYGVIETTIKEFLKSLNLTIKDFFDKNTDLYNYKEEF
ncbi:hypothetical protein KA977_04280 [Candidatus Dependentiae bacterium]|nr:hypothetical protein [Candidatus Dependentiae bacterium]